MKKPKNFERIKEIACILSQEFPFVRVDLYNIDGNISEMTVAFINIAAAVPLPLSYCNHLCFILLNLCSFSPQQVAILRFS